MTDSRKMIPPRTQIVLRDDRLALQRLFRMDDAALGRELLELARDAVAIRNDQGHASAANVTSRLLFRVIPHLARRLDPSIELSGSEIPGAQERALDPAADLSGLDGKDLRDHVALVVVNADVSHGLEDQRCGGPIRLLGETMLLLNPVIMALDRVSPAPLATTPGKRILDRAMQLPGCSMPRSREVLPGFYVMVRPEAAEREIVIAHSMVFEQAEDTDRAILSGQQSRGWSNRVIAKARECPEATILVRNDADDVVCGPFALVREAEFEPALC